MEFSRADATLEDVVLKSADPVDSCKDEVVGKGCDRGLDLLRYLESQEIGVVLKISEGDLKDFVDIRYSHARVDE